MLADTGCGKKRRDPGWDRDRGCLVRRVLIANRGEIALRAVRACRALGLESVAVHSSADGNSPHVWAADHAVCIGPPPPGASYLQISSLTDAAKALHCDAVYPGYGFLSEKSEFAKACRSAGLTFIGPDEQAIAAMGDKAVARKTAASLGLPVVPGSEGAFTEAAKAAVAADAIGFPLLLKASGGGGGRGMRVVERADDFTALFTQASAEAAAAFGQPEIYLERFFAAVRHVEVQVFGDAHGNYVHLWERDCSVQRRHQKLIEEAPSPVLDDATRRAMAEAALTLVRALDYQNAGTVEFIYDPASGRFFFIEMNTRIQVEHGVTEMVTGIDLVKESIRLAMGEKLRLTQRQVSYSGAAIECRVYAEDPDSHLPSPGVVANHHQPGGLGVRVETALYDGYQVPVHYDPLVAKLIVHADGRAAAIARAKAALREYVIDGIQTNIPLHLKILDDADFQRGNYATDFLRRFEPAPTPVEVPRVASRAS